MMGSLVGLLASVACSADPYVSIADWNLSTMDGKSRPIHAPQRLDDLLPRSPATYWLDAEVALPPQLRARPLTLTWPDTHAFATLSIDGLSIPPLPLLPFDRVRPSRNQLVFRVPATATDRATLHLRLRVQHLAPWTASIGLPPRLAPGTLGEHQLRVASRVNYALIVIAAAVLTLFALTAGVAFLNDRRRAAAGWYVLMNLGCLTIQMTGLGLTQLVVPNDVRRVPLLALPVVCVCGMLFTHAHFRLKPPRRMCLALVVLAAVTAVLEWPPFASRSRCIALVVLQGVVTAIYQTVTVGRLVRQPEWRAQAIGNLAATAVLLAATVLELRPHLIDPFPIACVVCAANQGMMLVRLHALGQRALDVALESRVSLLEDRNREVTRLNEELRLQAHHRSDRLAVALERLQRLSGARDARPAIGTVLGGYKVLGPLGQEGPSAVYEVERIRDGQRFALKALAPGGDGNELARLAREAHLAAEIAHPNLVDILDIDVDASGLPYLVMELVKGEPLSANRTRFGDPAFAREVVRQVAQGLAALHDAGIVHRNLTPASLLLESRADGAFCVKIVDFGLPRASSPAVAESALGGVLDTDGFIPFVLGETGDESHDDELEYDAPELSDGAADAGPACDLWSLGVVASQMIERRSLTGPLRSVVERCLDLDPRRRPSAAEVVASLA
jgi:hypothetical protein